VRELPYTDREADGEGELNLRLSCSAKADTTSERTGCSMVELIRAEAKQTAEVELSGPEALGAPPLHGFQSIGCACLAQHAAEMVFHGLFGQIQP
jgi:hypothetical protein